MKKIVWKNTLAKQREDFYCYVSFVFCGSEIDYNALVDHYNHIASIYHFEMLLFHRQMQNDDDSCWSFQIHFRKTKESLYVPPNWALSLLENDVKILQRIFQLESVQFADHQISLNE